MSWGQGAEVVNVTWDNTRTWQTNYHPETKELRTSILEQGRVWHGSISTVQVLNSFSAIRVIIERRKGTSLIELLILFDSNVHLNMESHTCSVSYILQQQAHAVCYDLNMTYLFAHTVYHFKILGIWQKCICVNCYIIMQKRHHICI